MKKIISGMILSAMAATQAYAISMPLEDYNLVLEGSFEQQGGSVWGTSFIGGDIFGNAAEFAVNVDEAPIVDSIKVVGDIRTQVKVHNGNLVHGGSIAATGGSVDLYDRNIGATISYDANLSVDPLIADLRGASDFYASLEANVSYVRESEYNNNWDFTYSGDSAVAVFSGSYDDIFKQNAQIGFDGVDAETVVINVSGENIALNSSYNFPGFDKEGVNGLGAANILWNFYEATSLNLGGSNFMGSILAMNAHVTLTSTLEGSLGAKSLTSQRQIHDYNYQTVNPVPLPGSLILFGSALIGLGAVKRKTKKA